MVSFGESYFAAFVLDLGGSNHMASLIQVLPLGIAAILFAVLSRRPWVRASPKSSMVAYAALQGLSLMGAGKLPGLEDENLKVLLLFSLTSLYWTAALFITPLWNFWLFQILKESQRQSVLSYRVLVSQMSIGIGLLAGSLLIPKLGYAMAFDLAAMARGVSVLFLLWLPSPKTDSAMSQTAATPTSSLPNTPVAHSYFYVFGFLFLFFTSVFVCAPYFSPYMIEGLGLDMPSYGVLLSMVIFGRMVGAAILPWMSRHFSFSLLMFLSLLGVSALPSLWTLSQNFYYLAGLQLIGGVFWSVFELVLLLWVFSISDVGSREYKMKWYAFYQSLGMITGALLVIPFFELKTNADYFALFHTSTVLRLIILVTLFPVAFMASKPIWAQMLRLPILTPIGARAGGFSFSRIFVKSNPPSSRLPNGNKEISASEK